MSCAMERISRMEKAFYPRNDGTVVSELLPRDKTEDILEDFSGDKVYLERSSILDGTNVKGFGYLDGRPYKWHLEIESAVKSVAVVPDRFFSIYGKAYPIKRRQTVGINQPSEAFKYEIIYLRGYDKYEDETPCAKIIYHKQMEQNEQTLSCAVNDDTVALGYLNNVDGYPYLKIRVCWDGSIRAYLGSHNVDWDLKRQIEDEQATPDTAWVEIPQINTDQFRDIDLWVRFDSINALAYYLITKYESNIYDIKPKEINSMLPSRDPHADNVYISNVALETGPSSGEGSLAYVVKLKNGNSYTFYATTTTGITDNINCTEDQDYATAQAVWKLLVDKGEVTDSTIQPSIPASSIDIADVAIVSVVNGGMKATFTYTNITTEETTTLVVEGTASIYNKYPVSSVVGKDYTLEDPSWVEEADNDDPCTPCCKKDNVSRSIWAYVNPKTMTPFDDDYWFHQGEPYYKKSLTLSSKQNPLKAQKIFVEQGVFPGMYKIVGETYIRERETGEDQRVQISLPLCKIKSDHTLTLQADGDPTTFNLDVEVATPKNGIPMEITFYEVEKEMKNGCSGNKVPTDGSTRISAK